PTPRSPRPLSETPTAPAASEVSTAGAASEASHRRRRPQASTAGVDPTTARPSGRPDVPTRAKASNRPKAKPKKRKRTKPNPSIAWARRLARYRPGLLDDTLNRLSELYGPQVWQRRL